VCPDRLKSDFISARKGEIMSQLELFKKILAILVVLTVSTAMLACSTTEDEENEENADALDRML
jgi:hypothetical protein